MPLVAAWEVVEVNKVEHVSFLWKLYSLCLLAESVFSLLTPVFLSTDYLSLSYCFDSRSERQSRKGSAEAYRACQQVTRLQHHRTLPLHFHASVSYHRLLSLCLSYDPGRVYEYVASERLGRSETYREQYVFIYRWDESCRFDVHWSHVSVFEDLYLKDSERTENMGEMQLFDDWLVVNIINNQSIKNINQLIVFGATISQNWTGVSLCWTMKWLCEERGYWKWESWEHLVGWGSGVITGL